MRGRRSEGLGECWGKRDAEPERSGPTDCLCVFFLQPRSNCRPGPIQPPRAHFPPRLKRGRGPFKARPSLSPKLPSVCAFRFRTAGRARRRAGRGEGRGARRGAGGRLGGATRRQEPPPERKGVGRRSGHGTQPPRPPGRLPWTRGPASGWERPRRGRCRRVPSARAGARGVRAGRGGGAGGVGRSRPLPPPLSSDVRTSRPRLLWGPPRLHRTPGSRVEDAAPPLTSALGAFLDLLSVTRSWFRSPTAHPSFTSPKRLPARPAPRSQCH